LLNETDALSMPTLVKVVEKNLILRRWSSQHQHYRAITRLEALQSLSVSALKVRGDGKRYLTEDIKADNKVIEMNKSICHNDCGRTIDLNNNDDRHYSCHICRSVHYCSSDCQHQHYGSHAPHCYDLYHRFRYCKMRQTVSLSTSSCHSCHLLKNDLLDVKGRLIPIPWKYCGRCRIRYCSADCQQQHWLSHKPFCKQLSLLLPNLLTSVTPLLLDAMKESKIEDRVFDKKGGINPLRSHDPKAQARLDAVLHEYVFKPKDDEEWSNNIITILSEVQLLLRPGNGNEGNRDKAIEQLLETIDKIPYGLEQHRWSCLLYITLSNACHGKHRYISNLRKPLSCI
jgi:hypothetical protein